MSYLVMECHPGYAVVLDSDGRFFKVANRNYQVGQTVTSVIKMLEPDTPQESRPQSFAKSRMQIFAKSWMRTAAAAAACLFIMVMGARQFLIVPYGSVRMQINPDIQMSLNRLDYVIALEGLNTDGETLIDGYSFRWKSVEQVSDDLADRAIEYGYLTDGGNIHLTVNSSHEKWKAAAESRILLELEVHLGKTITVTAGDARMDEQTPDDDRESDTGNPSHPNKDSAPVSGNGNTSQNVIVIPVGPDAADEAVNDMDEDD
ncbi:MAG: hypothetical protein Q4F29_13825, partial [Lachnospiraceae bacterium]|nr:hypothetical protein [Lachnospiraceae bacterium]